MHEEEKKELVEPKTRAPGGVWVQASDIPHSFTSFIVYHNTTKMPHVLNHADKWTDATQPYICNEKDVVIRLELDEEALKAHLAEHHAEKRAELPGFKESQPPNFDQVLIGFAPHPTNKPHEVLPRYLMNLQQLDHEGEASGENDNPLNIFDGSHPVDLNFKSYFEGKLLTFTGAAHAKPVIYLRPNLVAP